MQAHKITEKFFDKEEGGQDDQIQAHTHPLVINTAPICRFHSLLSMYPDEELPQVVGSDILLLLLNVFKILPGVKQVNFDIQSGLQQYRSSSIYQPFTLPFAILLRSDIEQQAANIEHITKIMVKIKFDKPPRINQLSTHPIITQYTVAICINQINALGSYAFVLKPYNKDNEKLEYAEVTNSLSFVFGIIVNQLIQLNIPHNALISDNGETIYIFVRDFCTPTVMYGWVEFAGAIVVHDEKGYQVKQQQIIAKKKSLTIDAKTIQLLKSNIKKHLSKFI